MRSYLREMLRADFVGDGFEGILVSSYVSAIGGTLGVVSDVSTYGTD